MKLLLHEVPGQPPPGVLCTASAAAAGGGRGGGGGYGGGGGKGGCFSLSAPSAVAGRARSPAPSLHPRLHPPPVRGALEPAAPAQSAQQPKPQPDVSDELSRSDLWNFSAGAMGRGGGGVGGGGGNSKFGVKFTVSSRKK